MTASLPCPSCEIENRPGARFCDSCGGALARLCTACNTELRPEARFCDACGQQTDGAPVADRSTPISPASPSASHGDLPESATGGAVPPAPTPAISPAPAPTRIASGRYQVERLLGEGAKKRVFLARDTRLGREVALALVKSEGLDEAGRTRLQRETRAMGRLGDHPYVVSVHDIAEEGDQIYIVSQLMSGGSLESLLAEGDGHGLSIDQCLKIADQLAQALDHAHGHDIIHRDLKPGNVWLDQNGDVALGDFGLAVSIDRTRVTQDGMMVGTVAYMAPEQALGRPPDPRSDLYALGATLYEMLTGRPPFAGDDAVAIISQHINTPPVAASWHNKAISKALDALVLSLLAKDPDSRPQTAADLRSQLAAVAAARTGDGGSAASGSNPLDALAVGVFVGREAEVEQLRAGVDDALSGRGRVQLLVGEPGIGKTRTSEEIATYAKLRGAATLWGRCYEGEGAPTYWPWIQLIRAYVNSQDAATLLNELGAGASAIAEVVPEVRESLPGVQPAAPLEPDQARFRFFDSVQGFLRRASGRQPLVLVLDDLHWADKPSLMLLQFVARELADTRLLVLGTYRDVELGRTHPLAETLAELARDGSVDRVLLRGLDESDVARFVELTTGAPPPSRLPAAVYRETEGNPFFVNEVVRLLVSEGRLDDPDASDDWHLSIPQGIREVIGRRLSALCDDCNEVLTVASVAGREFELPVVARCAGVASERVLELIEEAEAGRLVEIMPDSFGRYRFSHALVRETLLDELGTAQRVRLHRAMAEALEVHYAGDLDQHLAELAHHAAEGVHAGGDVDRAVDYARRAGDRARSLAAFEDAEPHYDRALQALALLDAPDQTLRCDLLLHLAEARAVAVDSRRAEKTAREALALARELGDARRFALGTAYLARAVHDLGEPDLEAVALMREALGSLGDDECNERIEVLSALALHLNLGPTHEEGAIAAAQAVEIARRLGDPSALARSLESIIATCWGLDDLNEREAACRELRDLSRKHGDPAGEMFGQVWLRICATERGDRDEVERIYNEETQLLDRAQNAQSAHWHHVGTATLAIFDARWEDAEKAAAAALAAGQRVADELAQQMFGIALSAILRARGQIESLKAVLQERMRQHPQPGWEAALAASLADLGETDEALAILRRMAADDVAALPLDANIPVGLALLSTACARLRDEVTAPILYARLAPHPKRIVNVGAMASIYGCTSDYLGRLASIMGRHDEAVAHMDDALEVLERLRAHFWITDTKLAFSDILCERDAPGDRDRALVLLNEVIEASRRYDMAYFTERAMSRKLRLQGVEAGSATGTIHTVHTRVQSHRPELGAHAAPDGTVTIMFSDMEGFTAMTERLGDLRAREVIRRHNGVVREQLHAYGGYEVELQGDGFLLAFGSARQAVLCAVAIQLAFEQHNTSGADETIRVRIGLHTGEALRDADKFFGKTVILAARIASEASGGEILVSSLLKQLTESTGDIDFGEPREIQPKGIATTVDVHRVEWRGGGGLAA